MEVSTTPFGPIMGVNHGRCVSWLGLRYATAARFELPQMTRPWAPAMYNATAEAPSCPQAANYETSPSQSEDCLYMNIWLPAAGSPNRTLAFIHGGGFSSGSIGMMYAGNFWHDGCELAASRGVAVVTMQYRLGALGWLARPHPNLGLRDQTVALRFTRRLLGPAAARLLIFGHSAGSISVCAHLFSPASHGLFDAAVLLSSIACPTFPLRAAEVITDGFLSASPCRQPVWGARAEACLRNLSVDQVLQTQGRLTTQELEERRDGSWQFRSSDPNAESVGAYNLQLMWAPAVEATTLPIFPMSTRAPMRVPVLLSEVAEAEMNAMVYDGGPVGWSSSTSHEQLIGHVTTLCSTPK